MVVIFVSQCQKKALKRTRRILDAFAQRIGERTWQTIITEQGLDTVKKLLRQSATKSTAISCHRLRRQKLELMWTVGNKKEFTEEGVIAVNRTKCAQLPDDHQHHWQSLNALAIVSHLAALLHDIGKSTDGFQEKLQQKTTAADPYRHEWISLKLWIWLCQKCTTDAEVFQRLQNIESFLKEQLSEAPLWCIAPNELDRGAVDSLPPICQWIAWLIVTHHRLPPLEKYFFDAKTKARKLKIDHSDFKLSLPNYYKKHLNALDKWVKNQSKLSAAEKKKFYQTHEIKFYQTHELVLCSPIWQKEIKRYVQKAECDPFLQTLSAQNQVIADPFLLMLSRMIVMVADHHYSSEEISENGRDWGKQLAANTHPKHHEKINQYLDEHLIGVAKSAAEFCRQLPLLHHDLPHLKDHDFLVKDTAETAFIWQNNAFKMAEQCSKESETNGFFGINMASTGSGKTIANARIMYALSAREKGARITIALGLRVLTLQTGLSFRRNLDLNDQELAVLVGGSAQKQLFEYTSQTTAEKENLNHKTPNGSESAESWFNEYIDADDSILDELPNSIIKERSAQQLLGAPIVVCTIDHLTPASETPRGGKYIAPLLRLLSSDLILDEPDDFDQNDLPALSRLVHLAGLLGTRVLLSSATLPPDMVFGLFTAYHAGRKIYNAQFGYPQPEIQCAWFDEQHIQTNACADLAAFSEKHQQFIKKRCAFLNEQPPRRKGEIVAINAQYDREEPQDFYQQIARQLLLLSQKYHQRHHVNVERHQISIGLIRMANIQPLMAIAQAMHQIDSLENAEDCVFHLCCYHSQQVLALRNRLETRLDALLTRHNATPETFAKNPDIAAALKKFPQKTHHIFIVLATAVAEVGRDHDYDWALVEPSSMRSIIQLAGRVWRHRPSLIADEANIGIWQNNIRALIDANEDAKKIAFTCPGFESKDYHLETHDMNELIDKAVLNKIDAVRRIHKAEELDPENSLPDLEHRVMKDLMNCDKPNVVNAYFRNEQTANRSHVHLSVLTPFRDGRAQDIYIVKPDGDDFDIYMQKSVELYGFQNDNTNNYTITPQRIETPENAVVTVWLESRLETVLKEIQEKVCPDSDWHEVVQRFATATLASEPHYFDERFGFWKK